MRDRWLIHEIVYQQGFFVGFGTPARAGSESNETPWPRVATSERTANIPIAVHRLLPNVVDNSWQGSTLRIPSPVLLHRWAVHAGCGASSSGARTVTTIGSPTTGSWFAGAVGGDAPSSARRSTIIPAISRMWPSTSSR